MAAVKISSARRKAAWKFWAPQQSHLNFMTKGNKDTARKSGAPVKQKQNPYDFRHKLFYQQSQLLPLRMGRVWAGRGCPAQLFERSGIIHKKNTIHSDGVLFMLALPIFPGRLQPSIVGRSELNFRVRDGNGWTLALISTNLSAQQCSVMPTHVQLLAP